MCSPDLLPAPASSSGAAPQPNVSKASRVTTLSPGEYWRALCDLEGFYESNTRTSGLRAIGAEASAAPTVAKGTLLLLLQVHVVEGLAHAAELHPHPSEPGGEARRMLIEPFLECFEHVDQTQARRERQAEMRALSERASTMADDLHAAWNDPARSDEVLREGLALLEAKETEKGGTVAEPPGTLALPAPARALSFSAGGGEEGTGGGLISALTAGGDRDTVLAGMKASVLAHRRSAEAMGLWLQARSEAVRAAHAAVTPFHSEVSAAFLASTARAVRVSGDIQTALATVGVYCGEGVQVEPVRRGSSASPAEPLYLFQARAYCDEELSVFAEIDEKWGSEHLDEFDAALREQIAFVDQVFSGRGRAVLLMSATRRMRDERSIEEDRKAFLLVRDGENVFRVRSSIATHVAGETDRLFPTVSEAGRPFVGLDGKYVKVESLGYSDAVDRFESRARHYLRFLYLLCGLDHRESLFGEFYPAEFQQSTAFLGLDFQARYFRFVFDADPARQLPDGRPLLSEWLRAQNRQLQSGSRVLCHWATAMTPETAPAVVRHSRTAWRDYEWRYEPWTPTEVVVAYREAGRLKVGCKVAGRRSCRSLRRGDRAFEASVDLTPALACKQDFSGFLCLDAATADELAWYVANRSARQQFVSFVRLFKAGIAYLRQEQSVEAATRGRLASELVDGGLAKNLAEARGLVSEAVIAWRAARRGAALPSYAEGEALPDDWQQLRASLWTLARRGVETDSLVEACADLARSAGREPLRLVSSGKTGALVLYCSPSATERCDDLTPESSVIRIRLERRRKKPLAAESEQWATLMPTIAKEVVLKEWPGTSPWVQAFAPALARSVRLEVTQCCRAFPVLCSNFLVSMAQAEWQAWFARYKGEVDADRSRSVFVPDVLVPFACVYSPDHDRSGRPWFLAMSMSACSWLQITAPSEADATVVRSWTVGRYADGRAGAGFHGSDEARTSFCISLLWTKMKSVPPAPFLGKGTCLSRWDQEEQGPLEAVSLLRWMRERVKEQEGRGRMLFAAPELWSEALLPALSKLAARLRGQGEAVGRP